MIRRSSPETLNEEDRTMLENMPLQARPTPTTGHLEHRNRSFKCNMQIIIDWSDNDAETLAKALQTKLRGPSEPVQEYLNHPHVPGGWSNPNPPADLVNIEIQTVGEVQRSDVNRNQGHLSILVVVDAPTFMQWPDRLADLADRVKVVIANTLDVQEFQQTQLPPGNGQVVLPGPPADARDRYDPDHTAMLAAVELYNANREAGYGTTTSVTLRWEGGS
jgi:hypothetical protein